MGALAWFIAKAWCPQQGQDPDIKETCYRDNCMGLWTNAGLSFYKFPPRNNPEQSYEGQVSSLLPFLLSSSLVGPSHVMDNIANLMRSRIPLEGNLSVCLGGDF